MKTKKAASKKAQTKTAARKSNGNGLKSTIKKGGRMNKITVHPELTKIGPLPKLELNDNSGLTKEQELQSQTVAAIDRYLESHEHEPYESLLEHCVSFLTDDGLCMDADHLEYFFEKVKNFLFIPSNASLFYNQTKIDPRDALEILNRFITFYQCLQVDSNLVDADITRWYFAKRFPLAQRLYQDRELDLDMEIKFYNKKIEQQQAETDLDEKYNR